MNHPRAKSLKGFGCPEGCRKKFSCIGGLNHHLSKVHNSNYTAHLHNGKMFQRPKKASISLVPVIRIKSSVKRG